MKRRLVAQIVVAACLISPGLVADDQPSAFEQASRAITELELERARRLLESVGAESPAVNLERARMALHAGDCDTALTLVTSPSLAQSAETAGLTPVARGCAQAMAGAEQVEDKARGVWIRLQDPEDRVLVPFMAEVADSTRRALATKLGIELPRPIRIELVRDLFSLAAVSGLPLSAAQTTGTVGVARLGRVILVSPRATTSGYPWQDTLAHELVHLAITRATRDKAPLWLQEGIAKLYETSWREPRPFDDTDRHLGRAKEALLAGQAIGLDELGPSIAFMPTPEQATTAYAEVTSFVEYWLEKNGNPALHLLLMDLRGMGDKGPDSALRSVTGYGLPFWQADWHRHLVSLPETGTARDVPNNPGPPANMAVLARGVRLGDLLFQRGHYAAAALKLNATVDRAPREASVRWRAARAMAASGRPSDAVVQLGKLEAINGPHAGWYALQGRFSAEAHDQGQAERWAGLALAYDPLSVDVACEGHWCAPAEDGPTKDPVLPNDPARRALCIGARRIPHD